jgi:hypothetical protein
LKNISTRTAPTSVKLKIIFKVMKFVRKTSIFTRFSFKTGKLKEFSELSIAILCKIN